MTALDTRANKTDRAAGEYHLILLNDLKGGDAQGTLFQFKTIQPYVGLRFKFKSTWYRIESAEVLFNNGAVEQSVDWYAVVEK